MVVAETEHSNDALLDWADEITRYDDLRPAMVAARAYGSISGTRLLVEARPANGDAVDQRTVLAEAVVKELEGKTCALGQLMLILFDTFWVPDTAVHRTRGVDRLVERAMRKHEIAGRLVDADAVTEGASVRWAAVLDLDQDRLPHAIAAVEREEAALLFPSRGTPKTADLLHDLFADADDVLTTRVLWPLWAARRTGAGDAVLLVQQLNDHTGRLAFLLTSPEVA